MSCCDAHVFAPLRVCRRVMCASVKHVFAIASAARLDTNRIILLPHQLLPQELLHLLESSPGRLQAAFAMRACKDPQSPSFAMQPRHSLLPLSELPAVLGEAMPGWLPQVVSYAAIQLSWHVNVVSYTSDSPVGHAGLMGKPGRPSNMMYAEMAASIIAAAETEAAATDSRLLPGAQQFLSAVYDALSTPEGNNNMLHIWKMQEVGATR